MVQHKDLTGAELHEPKGVETASSGEVYVADGSGSGSWQAIPVPQVLFSAMTSPGGKVTIPDGTPLFQGIQIILDALDPAPTP